MLVQDLIIVFILILIGIGWWHDRGIKQAAYSYAKARCAMLEVQLLDQHVRLTSIKLRSSRSNLFCLERHFAFEFTEDGDSRYSGRLVMLGNKLESIETEAHRYNPAIH